MDEKLEAYKTEYMWHLRAVRVVKYVVFKPCCGLGRLGDYGLGGLGA